MSGPQIGDSLSAILGGSARVMGNEGRPSFATLSAMPDAGIHVEPAAKPTLSMNFIDKSIGNLPSPATQGPLYQPAPTLQPRGLTT